MSSEEVLEEETLQILESAEKRQLDINIISIVIGALVIITILAWINVFKSWCEHVFEDDRKDRYKETKRKLISAVIVTALSLFIVAVIVTWVTNTQSV